MIETIAVWYLYWTCYGAIVFAVSLLWDELPDRVACAVLLLCGPLAWLAPTLVYMAREIERRRGVRRG